MTDTEGNWARRDAEIGDALDGLGAALRARAPRPSDDLLARVLADAAETHAAAVDSEPVRDGAVATAAVVKAKRAIWSPLRAWLTGPGLVAAMLMLALAGGIGAGYATGPSGDRDLAASFLVDEPGFDMFAAAALF
ncbi:MAG: hypothetical protein AAGC57_15105 [Pseudomonadota bacterium]